MLLHIRALTNMTSYMRQIKEGYNIRMEIQYELLELQSLEIVVLKIYIKHLLENYSQNRGSIKKKIIYARRKNP
jgi:hypothetical protein